MQRKYRVIDNGLWLPQEEIENLKEEARHAGELARTFGDKESEITHGGEEKAYEHLLNLIKNFQAQTGKFAVIKATRRTSME